MEACSSTTPSNQKPRLKRKSDGRILRTEFEIMNERLRNIHPPLIDIKPITYGGKFLGRYRLYIGNISNNVTKEDLENTFKAFGEVNDVYIQPNKNFGFIRMDYFHNAIKAKHQLHGTALKDRKIYITFSPQASITVKHLSPSVSNELLHVAFSVFGEVEFCYIVVDKRGKPTGEGVVDFVKKSSAMAAKKYCSEHLYFVTASLKTCNSRRLRASCRYGWHAGRNSKFVRLTVFTKSVNRVPLCVAGLLQYEYAQHYRELWDSYNMKLNMLKADQESAERELEVDLMRAKYDHETERLKDMIRQREVEKERYCKKLEEEVRQSSRGGESQLMDNPTNMEFKPPDNLFLQASQLSNMLDSEEREIQEQQWRMSDYRSEYEMSEYSDSFYDHNRSRRKVPEVIVHCQKRQRSSK
ncbi:hypothetical protein NQ317_014427 [Molorchus minor]|uniref:RRM domain-containing protein n=1 Tax=Molorchus minor TaxID=1323400 RepID=A0ABQ9K642_9CUCU|nr:hypothetical protein NQ317_014427 [Molorchus minor]